MSTSGLPEREVALLGGGCYWCLEAVFEQLRGVLQVESGFAGGAVPDPTYRQICEEETGHAEVVRIAFDPAQVSYRDILEVFFATHDPTTLNRQGADVGTQYRSVVYFYNEAQAAAVRSLMAELAADKVFSRPIVTEVQPAPTFYKAEAYHQGYYQANPTQPYCQAVIAPKLHKFREKYAQRLKRRGE